MVFKAGGPPLITLFGASRDGGGDPEYSAIRLSFGFPPGPMHALVRHSAK